MSDTSTTTKGKGGKTAKDADKPTEPEAAATTEATEKVDPEQVKADLVSAIDAALAGAGEDGSLSEELQGTLQTAYRKVPAARRGQLQAEIFGSLMGREGLNTQALASILEVMVKAPAGKKGTGTRKAAAALPPEQAAAASLVVLQLATQAVLARLETDELRNQAREAAKTRLGEEVPEGDDRDALLARVEKAIKASSVKAPRASGGSTGERGSMSEGMTELLARGDVKEGTVLVHGEVSATVTADGKIAVKGVEGSPFASPSAAASAVLKSQGKSTAVNGWAWWSVKDGDKTVTLGSLRKG